MSLRERVAMSPIILVFVRAMHAAQWSKRSYTAAYSTALRAWLGQKEMPAPCVRSFYSTKSLCYDKLKLCQVGCFHLRKSVKYNGEKRREATASKYSLPVSKWSYLRICNTPLHPSIECYVDCSKAHRRRLRWKESHRVVAIRAPNHSSTRPNLAAILVG